MLIRSLATVVLALLLSAPAFVGTASEVHRGRFPAKIFLEQLLSMPLSSYGLISPDGKWIAWSWFHTGPAADVYVAPTDGSRPPTRLTATNEDTMVASWTPDSTALLVKEDKSGNERQRIFKVNLATPLVMIPLTEDDPAYFLRGGQLHPNDRWLVYAANYDFVTRKEIEPTCVYRHDLKTGERKLLAKPSKGGFVSPDLNKQGTHILYERNDLNPAGQQIWLVDIDGKEDKEILNFGADKKVSASWFPDGKRVLFLAEAKDYRRLGVYDVTDGSIKWLIDDPKRNIEGAWAPERSDKVVIVEVVNAREYAFLLDLVTLKEQPLPPVAGTLIPLEPAADGTWIGTFYSATQPADFVRFGLKDASDRVSLTRIWQRTKLRPTDLACAEDFSWQSADGLTIHGWLYKARQPKGTIVVIHGGPTGHSEDAFDVQIQFLVAQGFNVLDPNYRGSTGYGLAFQESIKKDGWGGKEQEDIRSGIEALIKEGIATRGKIGATGTSYGGYSSWFAITHFPADVVAASAPICGMTDLAVDYETTRPDLRPYSEEMMGGSPEQVPERYKERSPINHVQNIKGRLLIVQGEQDPNVTPANVREVESALQKSGVKYEVLRFADEGHGISKQKNERILYLKLADFFERALAGEPAPISKR